MKSTFTQNKLICTIISETPYSKNSEGKLVGLDPTVEEIDHLSSLFKQVFHFAPVHNTPSPASFIKHQKPSVKIIPMIPVIGGNIIRKLEHVIFFCYHLLKIWPYLKKTDIIHYRAPTGFGVLFLPWLLLFWKKKIWIKYGGSWNSKDVPITYKFQRWLLLLFPEDAIITINNSTETLGRNFLQFYNPCFKRSIIKANKTIVNEKNFSNGLNLVFVGRVEKNKGIDHIFKVFKKIDQMKEIKSLKIIGGSEKERYYNEKASEISPKIAMLGLLNRKDIFKIYSKSHILILLSKSEGFPKVIMEAAVFGCVPIVSNFDGISKIIQHGHNGFIMNSYNSRYDYKEFQKIFDDKYNLKACSMNIFRKSHSFTYEQYLEKISNAILH